MVDTSGRRSGVANAMIARGYRAVVVGMDWSLLQRGIASVVEGVRL